MIFAAIAVKIGAGARIPSNKEKMQIAGIVLAAGAATRMGELKQLLPVAGQPMVRRVAQAVCQAGLAQVVVVIGARAQAVQQALAGLPLDIVVNHAWSGGMSTSFQAGLRALRPEIEAALIVLADQPGLSPGLIQALVEAYRTTGAPIVAPFHQGQRASPVLFSRALFPELLEVLETASDEGGRQVVARHRERMVRVEVDDPLELRDVDTRQDYDEVKTYLVREQEYMTGQRRLLALRHLIVDMDGVLYRGNEAIRGTNGFLSFMREQGIGFLLMTNNSTRTPQQYTAKLANMDVAVRPEEIFTSAQATARYMQTIAPAGARIFVVGMDGLVTALREAGFSLMEEQPDYVIAGMDFNVCMERLAQATLHIRAGARFIGTNPDLTFPSERGIVPGAGALLALLQAATGVVPQIIGKPGTAMVEQALAYLGATRDTTGMLGDRLETDILAGQRAGLTTLLVLSGVTDLALLHESEIQPDLVFDDVAHLHAAWQQLLAG